MIRNNLPTQPYKKFFGRNESMERIVESLLDGGIYIASIDGVGGIGKTALAYNFCQEKIITEDRFNYLIWITAKETVFDPFSTISQIKSVDNKFAGIRSLIYETLKVTGFYEDFVNQDFNEALNFFEDEILLNEGVFIVLDNLESVNDDEFFKYISNTLNKISAKNRDLKILTTSRKRKKILDNPIEIEGLKMEDGLQMLRYYAEFVSPFPIKDILKSSDHNNIKLLEKVGCIPLGIEFIIGQMSHGKTRGDVIRELEGYPIIDINSSENERKKAMSEIIQFSFKDMYETLDEKCQMVFKTIAALWKNRGKAEEEVSIDLLLPIVNYPISELNNILEILADNKLIKFLPENKFSLSLMSYNLVNQHYEKFSEFENEVIGLKNSLTKVENSYDLIELTINNARKHIEMNEYDQAETALNNALDYYVDNYKIYFEIAKLQKRQDKFPQANYNFEKALEITPYDSRIWIEKVDMEEKWNRNNIAITTCEKGIVKTKNEINLVLKLVNLSYITNCYSNKYSSFVEISKYYKSESKHEDYLKLQRELYKTELIIIQKNETRKQQFLDIVNNLVNAETSIENKINYLSKTCEIAKNYGWQKELDEFEKELAKAKKNEQFLVREELRKLAHYVHNKIYDKAKSCALRIIGISQGQDDESTRKALRQLFSTVAAEKDFKRIIFYYEDFFSIASQDVHCKTIFEHALHRTNELEKENIIKDILFGLQKVEASLRNLVLFVFDYDEDTFIKFVLEKQNKKVERNWIEEWTFSKNKALNDSAPLIHYSDLSHLRALLSWIKPELKGKLFLKSKEERMNYLHQKLSESLNSYINPERNESFHSRLHLFEKPKLIEFQVDTLRALNLIEEIQNLIVYR